MSESFLKALRWLILVEFAVVGTSAFILADEMNSVKPVMIGVMCYGAMYIMSQFWKDFRDAILLFSIIVFLALSFVAPYVPEILYVLFGMARDGYHPFINWVGIMAVLGVPIMTFVFHKYD